MSGLLSTYLIVFYVGCRVATGCADILAPKYAWISRVNDRLTMTCNYTHHAAHLTCKGTQWIGQPIECHPQGKHIGESVVCVSM